MSSVRVKVCFEPPCLLSKALLEQGSHMCWLLIPPPTQTIKDLSDHITSIFQLKDACRNGIILTVDGFNLLPSESVALIRDGDMIQVQKREISLAEQNAEEGAVQDGDGEEPGTSDRSLKTSLQKTQLTSGRKKQPKAVTVKLKRKKSTPSPIPQPETISEAAAEKEASKKPPSVDVAKGTKRKKDEKRAIELEVQAVEQPKDSDASSQSDDSSSNKSAQSSPAQQAEGGRQGPSRSARRKKLKKLRIRQETEQQKAREVAAVRISPRTNSSPTAVSELFRQNKGHIRFTEEGEAMAAVTPEPPTINLGHITSKRQGQSWGQQGQAPTAMPSPSWFGHSPASMAAIQSPSASTATPASNFSFHSGSSEDPNRAGPLADKGIEYEGLPGLAGDPKVGDVIAYRLVELTATFTPEMSSFREGEVASFDRSNCVVFLKPTERFLAAMAELRAAAVVGLEEEEEDEWSSKFPFPYSPDGTLEIDMSSLTDIRLIASRETGGDTPTSPVPGTTPVQQQSLRVPEGSRSQLSLDLTALNPDLQLTTLGQRTPYNTPQGHHASGVRPPGWSSLKLALEGESLWSPGVGSAMTGPHDTVISSNSNDDLHAAGVGVLEGSLMTDCKAAQLLEQQDPAKAAEGGADVVDSAAAPAAMDFSFEIEKKRQELTMAANGEDVAQPVSTPSDNVKTPNDSGRRGSSNRIWRSGGVGPTLAFLRAERQAQQKQGGSADSSV